ncbi:hypothetical protein B14911_14987 [Bacillus sp. NRRL B-14911]|uniref:Lipoprotein n=3 Tax=Bacillales TaxID=1385 RepID=U5L9B6_9BACI|nr:hypothetical protein N288_06295 [Bacillus infantis NRRL B-14911]EAR66683.1 hypothetical protein B14911_14987 [Bacillus sp. NRRL B-14911]MCK6205837.1 PCYCGC domain-containing protein [Bacillus infantis]OXT17101.1 hypothetical protein B9K06_12105 [Bacillus sp. OG2]PLR71935.1 hypothetical protein CYJ37_18875 [Bacillus sp. UMB0728]
MKRSIFPILAAITLAAGCSSAEEDSSHAGHSDEHKDQGAPELTYTLGSNDWAAVTTYTDSPEILEAYQFAVEHPEVLNYMPCYCGCYEEDGHESNTNCFVDSVSGSTVSLDTMGFG